MKNNLLRNVTSFFAMIVLLTATSAVSLAMPGKNTYMGEIKVSGNSDGNGAYVLLNGEKAYNGRTFISTGDIVTEKTSATVNLNELGSVNLAPDSNLSLNVSEGKITGTLTKGKIQVFSKTGVQVAVQTPEKLVTNNNSGSLTVDVTSGKTVATPQDDDDDDDDDVSAVPLFLVFAGVVAAVATFVYLDRDDDDGLNVVSPVS